VASFNIHGGRGTDGVRDLSRIAGLVRGFDFIGLNEVHGPGESGPEPQVALLGRDLHQQWLFAPTERRWWHDHFGNGALTNLPVSSWNRIPLPSTQRRGFRNLVWFAVPWQGQSLNVVVTHVDRQADRELQLRHVLAWFHSLSPPALLLGDLNTTRADPVLAAFLKTSGAIDLVGPPADPGNDDGRIDWIFSRGLVRVAAGSVANEASDHPLVWAEVRIPAGSPESPPADGQNRR
jgi:endonuclease/exonuclease/phosphatase family metal-dependent hydrolase